MKDSYLMQITCAQLHGFKCSLLIFIIHKHMVSSDLKIKKNERKQKDRQITGSC